MSVCKKGIHSQVYEPEGVVGGLQSDLERERQQREQAPGKVQGLGFRV